MKCHASDHVQASILAAVESGSWPADHYICSVISCRAMWCQKAVGWQCDRVTQYCDSVTLAHCDSPSLMTNILSLLLPSWPTITYCYFQLSSQIDKWHITCLCRSTTVHTTPQSCRDNKVEKKVLSMNWLQKKLVFNKLCLFFQQTFTTFWCA